jgi:sterol desaturase/sphingolipid hydroxylase (fatty acid hydroxylase superfamily)
MRAAAWRTDRRLPGWLSGVLVIGAFGALVWRERRRPLREAIEPKLRRDARNLAVAALSAATLRVLEKPVVEPLAEAVERRRWGLLKQLALPAWAELPLAVILMDYTLYVWHVLTHRVPWLWRFHLVHHVDLDLSATTALRFHFAEMALSVPWRAGQVLLLGVAPRALSIWQTALLASILFHHSNLRLPLALERRLVRLIVTPRMHGIHHSTVEEETDSNWSSGLTLWDRLHGTLRLDVPQDAIMIGVPAYREPEAVALPKILAMPFGPERDAWELPGQLPEGSRSNPLHSLASAGCRAGNAL